MTDRLKKKGDINTDTITPLPFSAKNKSKGDKVCVYDDAGNDVTPRGLIPSQRNLPAFNFDGLSALQRMQMNIMKDAKDKDDETKGDDMKGNVEVAGEETQTEGQKKSEHASLSHFAKISTKTTGPLTTEDLAEFHTISIEETSTQTILHIRGTCIAQDSQEHPIITSANEQYEKLCAGRERSDNYIDRLAQTHTPIMKHKESQCTTLMTSSTGSQATSWDIYDAEMANKQQTEITDEDEDATNSTVNPDGNENSNTTSKGTSTDSGSASSQNNKTHTSRMIHEAVSTVLSNPRCLLTMEKDGRANSALKTIDEIKVQEILNLPSLMSSLQIMERRIMQHLYTDKQMSYRAIGDVFGNILETLEEARRRRQEEVDENDPDYDIDAGVDDDLQHDSGTGDDEGDGAKALMAKKLLMGQVTGEPELKHLWSFKCEMTYGKNVSCIVCNPEIPDLIAVAYGEYDFSTQQSGMILLWSLHNPDYPLYKIHSKCGVTSLDWSKLHANLLAAGFYDGTVAIYDIRAMKKGQSEEKVAALDSTSADGKHSEAVWDLCWLDKGNGRGETLVSISTDGRITEWSMKKGLEHQDLMLLKRVSKPSASKVTFSNQGTEGIISRQSSGMTLDFPLGDNGTYLAGTADGAIHKCSCSYNEQYVGSYFGHQGPVYRVRCSPFSTDIFLSCSADWTIRLWNQHDTSSELLNFHTTGLKAEVRDIQWSPSCSTIFGAVTADGRLQVWDIARDIVAPVVETIPNRDLSIEEMKVAEQKMARKREYLASLVSGKDKEDGDGGEVASGGNTEDTNTTTQAQMQVGNQSMRDLTSTNKSFSRICFATNVPVIFTGDSDGNVDVFVTENMKLHDTKGKKQQADLLNQSVNLGS